MDHLALSVSSAGERPWGALCRRARETCSKTSVDSSIVINISLVLDITASIHVLVCFNSWAIEAYISQKEISSPQTCTLHK